ncbi:ribose-phosphate pyrophosphokinase [Arthrobacter sp. Hiyo6]|nr:ribose-phosphate pyrophosphokinase [Arthrobacter sp. Hiyo6]
MADLYKTAGADRIMSVDLHTSQIQGFFDGPVDHLMAIPLLADYIRTRVSAENITVVSPDTGRVRVAEQWAERLAGLRWHSCTRAVTSRSPTRPFPRRWLARSRDAPAS